MKAASNAARVGCLAVGFGLAAAIATGGGVAHADDTSTSDSGSNSSASADSGSNSGSTAANDTDSSASVDTPKTADTDAPDDSADESTEDESTADESTEDESTAEASTADPTPTSEAPVETSVETSTAETSAPETSTAETSAPETSTPEASTPETSTPGAPSSETVPTSHRPTETTVTDTPTVEELAPTETSSAPTTTNIESPTATDIAVSATSEARTVTLDIPTATPTVAAAAVTPAATPAPPTLISALLENPLKLISTFVDNVLQLAGTFGLSAGSGTPGDAPLLWTVAAWVRRELFNIEPAPIYNPATNVLLDDGRVLGHVILNDENGDVLTVVAGQPLRGTVQVNSDGYFLYTPNAEFAANGGTDTFTITVSEAAQPGGLSGLLNAVSFGLLGGPRSTTTNVMVTAGPIDIAVPDDGYGFGEGGNLVYLTDEELAKELDAVVAAGGTWIRMPVRWSMIEAQPGQLDWSSTDRIVAAAQARNLQVLATFVDAPEWARDGVYVSGPPVDMNQFALFTQLTVQRYGGYIDDWQIWNEPNLPAYYGFVENRPANYAAMLRAVYPAIKAVQPNSTVVAAGMAREEGVDSPGVFLLQMYEAGAQGYFDAYAMHPYVFPGGIDSDPLNAWSDVERVHYAMTVFGDGDKKIWLTEVGAPTTCEYCSLLEPFIGPSAFTVSEQEQAKQISDIFNAASQLDYVGPIFIHGIRDQGIFPDFWADSNFGALLTNDWQPKYTAWILANANRTTTVAV